jgi:hypothetical protein
LLISSAIRWKRGVMNCRRLHTFTLV